MAAEVVYLDVLLLIALLSFVMDYLLLWATAKATKTKVRPMRLAAAAGLGTCYFVAFYLASRSVIGYYGWMQFWPIIVGVSVAMLAVAFAPIPLQRLMRVTGFFYFIALSSGGAGMAAGYALRWGIAGQLLASIAAILIIAELGWGVVQKSIWQRVYQIPLEIALFGNHIRVIALLDTGNQLKDPLKGSKVVVVEHQAVAPLLPEHLREDMVHLEQGDLSKVSRLLTSAKWSARFRVIPFASLGRKNGLLMGFRPDEAAVIIEGKRIVLSDAIIGISPERLDPEGGYQALLHPELVQDAVGAQSAATPTIHRPKGESPHVTTPS